MSIRTKSRFSVSIALFMLLTPGLLGAAPVAAQAEPEIAFEVSNTPTEPFGPGAALLRAEDARLTRLEDRVVVEITMPTPIPGTYVYPASVSPSRYASPEVFTLWAFVFNQPEACVSSPEPPHCGPDDFTDVVRSGIYGVAGHLTSVDHSGGAFELDRGTDERMILRGQIVVADPPRANMPPDSPVFALDNPMGAEVHLAVAPHGQVEPASLATEIYNPAGDPTCGCWWVAFFAAPESP